MTRTSLPGEMAAHSDFSPSWLALREAADHRARDDQPLDSTCRHWLASRPGPLGMVDLGCGSGNNLRYLAPRLPPQQRWCLIDQDSALLAHARDHATAHHDHVAGLECLQRDLVHLDQVLTDRVLAETAIVTASALLDLVSKAWLEILIRQCAAHQCAIWLAMSINGDNALIAHDGQADDAALLHMDQQVQQLIKAHQQRDKGFNGALGTRAPDVAGALLEEAGYQVIRTSAPWQLDCRMPEEALLARTLVEGWLEAALEQAPDQRQALTQWYETRQQHIAQGRLGVRVGHTDLLAIPARSGARADSPRHKAGGTGGYRRLLASSTLRWVLTLIILGSVVWLVDLGALLARLNDLSARWLALALLISIPQVVLSAWRWRLTARYMGLSLPLPTAVSEYYLSTFLNQVLPGGVTGDLGRAWRHGARDAAHGAALRAVIIERASGQAALLLVALVTLLLFTPLRHGVLERLEQLGAGTGVPYALLTGTLAMLLMGIWAFQHPPHWLSALRRDLRRGLWNRRLWGRQLVSSLAIVLSYMLVFICCARALGEPLPTTTLMALTPPVLMAMAIPVSVAGWGIRESAAALVWILAGFPAQQGVAISVTYGAVILLSSLPGAVILLLGRHMTPRQVPG